MNEFLTPPIFLTLLSIGAFCIGIIVGLLCARAGRKSQLDASFDQGVSEGQKRAEESSKVEKEELAISLAEQFKDMRDGIVQTVQAYQKAVDTCGDKLTLPESELLALSASPASADVEAEAVEIEAERSGETVVASDEAQRDESDIDAREQGNSEEGETAQAEASDSTVDAAPEVTVNHVEGEVQEATETESVVASQEQTDLEPLEEEGEVAALEGANAKEDGTSEVLAKNEEPSSRVIH